MKLIKSILGIAAITLSAGLFISMPVNAQTSSANSAQGIEVSPASVELNAKPGGTYIITLHIHNVTSSSMVYTSSVQDFNSSGETGSPHIILDSKLPETASVRTWVGMIPKFTIGAQQQQEVTAKVVVPSNAEPGGHYGVLSFSGTAPQLNSTGVGLSASVGVLMLMRVDGAITEKADVASFYSANNDKQTSFFETSPVSFVTRIKNTGNIHIKPSVNIEIRDMFGGIAKTLKANESSANVLPNSIRRFDSKTDNSMMFGMYTANLSVGYGTNGQAITNTITFWVIPYKLVLAVLFIISTIIYIFSRLLKAYNKRIIQKSKHEEANKNKKTAIKKASVKLNNKKPKLISFKLSEHKHTGKLIHHRHTSHIALVGILLMTGLFLYVNKSEALA